MKLFKYRKSSFANGSPCSYFVALDMVAATVALSRFGHEDQGSEICFIEQVSDSVGVVIDGKVVVVP